MSWRLLEAVDDNNGGKINLKPSPELRAILEPMLQATGDDPLSISYDSSPMQDAVGPGLNDMAVSASVNPTTWVGDFDSASNDNGSYTYHWIYNGFWKRFKDIPAQYFAPWQSDAYYFGMGNPNDTSQSPGSRPYVLYSDEAEISGHPGVMNPPYCQDLTGCVCDTNGYSYIDVPPGPGAIGGPFYIQHDDGSPTYIPYKQTDMAAWHAFYIAVNETTNDFAYISADHATHTVSQVDNNDGYRLFIQTVSLYHKAYDYQYFIGNETDPDPDPDPPTPPGPTPPTPFDPGETSDGSLEGSIVDDGLIGGDEYIPQPTDTISSIGDPPTPTMCGTLFFTCYNVPDIPLSGQTYTELEKLANEMWSDNVWNELKKYYASPSDMIIGLYLLPFFPDDNAVVLPIENIRGGKHVFNAKGYRIDRRYATYDLGKCVISPRYNTYFDYQTKIKLYLPFIGEFELSPQDVMHKVENVQGPNGLDAEITTPGSEISLKYEVDYFTGTVVVGVYINGDLHYEFQGNCKIDLPFTYGVNNAAIQQTQNFWTTAAATAAGMVAGLAAGPAAAAAAAIVGGASVVYQGFKTAEAIAHGETVHINGQVGCLTGARSCPYPYIEIEWPKVDYIEDLTSYTGLSTHKSNKIGDATSTLKAGGFLVAESVQLEGNCGTDEERDEILKLLKEGIILSTVSELHEGG